MTEFIHDLGTLLVSIAAVASLVFVFSYLRVRWEKDRHGRFLIQLGAGFALIFGFVAGRAVAGAPTQDTWLEVIRLVVYGYGAVISVQLAWLERRANRDRK